MIFNALVVVLVLAITAMWGLRGTGRGLFSSMLACVCVVVSGAVAFGLWETMTYKFLVNLNEDMAWGLGLIIPFAVTLLVTRLISEALVPKNLDFGDVPNFIGGAAFGLVSAVITTGIIVLALGFFRFGPSILGYKAVSTHKGGSLVYDKALWVPVDKITVKFYEHLSQTAFSTSTPLASVAPRLYEQAAMQRMVYTSKGSKGSFTARNSIKGDQFDIKGRYEVTTSGDLLSYEGVDADGKIIRKNQEVTEPDGESVPSPAKIEGYVVEFRVQAGERSGQIVVGPGQVRLVGTRDNGEVFAVQPFSIVSSPEAGSGKMHRFPMNANDVFIPSVGGASSSYFTFEFIIPQDGTPENLIVKNFRVPVADVPVQAQYASSEKRDEALRAGELFAKFGITIGGLADVDKSGSVAISSTGRGAFNELENNAILPQGWVVATTTGTKGLEVTTVDKDKYITGGHGQFTIEELRQKGLDRKLRAERFASKRDTGIVQVNLKVNGASTRLGKALEATSAEGPPRLIDSKGRVYEAIGWVYSEGGTVDIRFDPGNPLRGMSDLPSALTSSKRDQTVFLIFQPTVNVTIDGFLLGNKQIATFDGGFEVHATS